MGEIEDAVLTRIHAVGGSRPISDPEYLEGLRAAVAEALEYALATVRRDDSASTAPPAQVLLQARRSARHGVGLEVVLRRYFAGYALLGDILVEEAERGGVGGAGLRALMRDLAGRFERLLEVVSTQYRRELEQRPRSSSERRSQLVERLLDGELVDLSGLGYDLSEEHLGVIAIGPDAKSALAALATRLDRRLLTVSRDDGTIWAWMGGRHRLVSQRLPIALAEIWPEQVALAVGEPSQGLTGWRLTHRQAKAALPIALGAAEPFVRYADVMIIAAARQDDLLAASLRQLYLDPLEDARDGGRTAIETLRAYLAAGRNITSTAARLRVNRHTVASRLRAVEERLGRSLDSCMAELEVALSLEKFTTV